MILLPKCSIMSRVLGYTKSYPDSQKHDWDAEKKHYDFHINSILICFKYVTRNVTTQAFCLRLTTFNTHFSGSTTK